MKERETAEMPLIANAILAIIGYALVIFSVCIGPHQDKLRCSG